MTVSTASSIDYVLGNTSAEHQRLLRQGRLLARITRHWLEAIGLYPGMRILDVGSGVGDMGLLLGSVGGPDVEIIGIDLDESALAIARHRAAEQGFHQIRFQVSDFREYEPDRPFDAIIGRSVLIHQPDPVAALKSLVRYLRPAGIIAFQEPWFAQTICHPRLPLLDDMMGWITRTFQAAGLDADLGARLSSIFAAAGMPGPQLCFENRLACRADLEICALGADTVRSLLPTMERLGITTREIVQPESLAQRLYSQAIAMGGGLFGVMPMVGAWWEDQ
jgi:2-polyprenyl-3-methyl-5-hydroxy-6-metoxy-1,4-benzoquinol methylase